MRPLVWLGPAVLVVMSGVGTDRWILYVYSGGPQQRLAAAMAGLFVSGLVALIFLVAKLVQKKN